ncbi:hypothetical protein A4X09_0g6103 [Tilletia walkeri]|uniref:Uncharacterized protein n=1 Tax=Tilletia walkeri TaxID=117179 RepID=A0A8X7T2H9_9BASI|nr:hypothetical protein A4X09_0g6103 [Tilletia walkeri]
MDCDIGDVLDDLSLEELPLSSVTCLDINLDGLNSDRVILLLERLVQTGRLDRLVELAVRFPAGKSPWRCDSCTESMAVLAEILDRLSDPRITALRALWVGYRAAEVLTSDSELRTVVKNIPHCLRYISWHVPSSNTTQFFRVLPPSYLTASQLPSSSSDMLVLGPSQRARLQQLPASFRPTVDKKTGIWQGLGNEPGSHLLFDHMGKSPHLKWI